MKVIAQLGYGVIVVLDSINGSIIYAYKDPVNGSG
jgi:hypothetical protein